MNTPSNRAPRAAFPARSFTSMGWLTAAVSAALLLVSCGGGGADNPAANASSNEKQAQRQAVQASPRPTPSPAPKAAYGPFPFVNYETPHVHPLERTPDGTKLLAVNTAEGSLMVFDIAAGVPTLSASLPTGVDPVTVRARSNNEAWVLNRVSSTVSIVDLQRGEVSSTFDVCHEPGDVVFVGTPQKAVISCTRPNQLMVLEASTRSLIRSVTVAGESPRALATSADGSTVYAAIFESGTPTTVLAGDTSDGRINNATQNPAGPWGGRSPVPNAGAVFDPPMNPNNPPPPPVSTIVRKVTDGYFSGSVSCKRDVFGDPAPGSTPRCWVEDPANGARTLCAAEGEVCRFTGRRRVLFGDGTFFSSGAWRDDAGGDWTSIVTGRQSNLSNRIAGWDLRDRDVAILDVASGRVSYQTRLLNAVMAISVHPASGAIYAVGTDAINDIRFEPRLQGRFLRVNMASFVPGGAEAPAIVDLNPHLNYQSAATTSPAERAKSLGDPRSIAWRADGARGYIAGMGSNNVAVVDAQGNRVAAFDVGEGPTGLALDETRGRLYVLNRFGATISVVGLAGNNVLATVPFFDPTPQAIREGRPFLYNTRISSSSGHVSCASCHIDGRSDRLAWDLGDPSGTMSSRAGFVFHPMKGPLKTQTLQNIIGSPSMHHRGDRADIFGFAGAFQSLLGRDAPLDNASMAKFEAFLAAVAFPPNPHRQLDNGLSSAVAVPGPAGTVEAYADARVGKSKFDSDCVSCHVGGRGRSDVRGGNVLHLSQPAAPESFQGFYERMGLFWKSVDGSTAGTGTRTNGAHDSTLENEDPLAVTQTNRAFLLSFEGPREEIAGDRSANAHAGVGLQVTLSKEGLPPVVETTCATEGGRCEFSGTREVIYGANGVWRSAVFTAGANCNNATFGDAVPNVVKSCRLRGAPLLRCAGEGQTCELAGTSDVFYGAQSAIGDARFAKALAVGSGIECNNKTFGDPLYGTVKACYSRAAEGLPGTANADPGVPCAADSERCSFAGTREVVYGSSGTGWRSGVFTDGMVCSAAPFGQDAASAAGKTCRVVGATLRRCASENGICAADGNNEVLYGAGSSGFVKRVVRNSTRCDNATFGDPAPGTVKSCYVRTAEERGRLAFMQQLADSGRVGLIYSMTRAGVSRGGYYVGNGVFQSDKMSETPAVRDLYAYVANGWNVTLGIVPRGTEYRAAVDANVDGQLNGDQAAAGSDPRGAPVNRWRSCASDQGVCQFTGTRSVRFGSAGAYAYGVFDGGVACGAAAFGDPLLGATKTCEVADLN